MCPVCSSDQVQEVFRVTGEHEPLKLIRRCEECGEEWPVTFAGDSEWLFLPGQVAATSRAPDGSLSSGSDATLAP